MTKLKTAAMIGALLLGSSAFALAQTGSTTTTPPSNTMNPTVTQPTTRSTTGSGVTTAPGPQSAMRGDQDVIKKLQAAGYSDVTDVKQGKTGYTASALKNGKRVKVDIDPTGRIESMD
jgi:hypothetical protein